MKDLQKIESALGNAINFLKNQELSAVGRQTQGKLIEAKILVEKLNIHSVVDSSNKGIEEIHKLIVKYSEAEKDIIKRREAVTDVWEITVVDLQLKTNKQFVNDLMLAAGALL